MIFLEAAFFIAVGTLFAQPITKAYKATVAFFDSFK